MSRVTEKFIQLKKAVGGNREKTAFEWTIGKTVEEIAGITGPGRANVRILAQLQYLIHLSEAHENRYHELIEKALDFLLECQGKEGVLTNQVCESAEQMLMPLSPAAKEYKLILAAHAHLDMNWMWSFQETVAITLATFRSILNIMEEYPDFCFSQSQASVYKIVEEYDPSMMEEIKERIAQGRWEVTATAWVETDKNLPSGESLLRHIKYTREYLTKVWGAKRLDVDFSPDTFGHSANVPEIDAFGEVKYYYHCRGIETDKILYRYQAPSGKEVLVYREHNWYNSGITPHIGTQMLELSKRSAGLKTGLIVYGVGDHGGGPTRRDVERALEMMNWKLFPEIHFGTLHEYFDEAAKVWNQLPVVKEEMNFIFQGCYSTQSRIKRGNRKTEAALLDAEHMAVLGGRLTAFPYAKKQMTDAWENVLFTHFHDIITGSCTPDSREYAMAMYQKATATANTQIQNAMQRIARNIDTSSIPVDIDAYNSQSEGAGVGYGVENFFGVPSTERGSGRTRIFHVFNTMAFERKETVELTVWDWTGDMKQIEMKDYLGNPISFQLLDTEQCTYWEHHYFRLLAEVEVPSVGYTTVVLSEKTPDIYPVYLNEYPWERIGVQHNDFVLENEKIKACIDVENGRIKSVFDKESGTELIAPNESSGFAYVETEPHKMSSWTIGRYVKRIPVDRCVECKVLCKGQLRQSIKAVYEIRGSKIEVIYSLDKGASAIRMDTTIDWRDHGVNKDAVPVLDYYVPVAYETEEYLYEIPAGSVRRKEVQNDVPALQYGLAVPKKKDRGLILISDCKYGYRGEKNSLSLKMINSAVYPDPYPEIGIHHITLWLGACPVKESKAIEMALVCNRKLFYQPSNCHKGTLSMEESLLKVEADNVVVSAITPEEDGMVLVRVYETAGRKETACITFSQEVERACACNLSREIADEDLSVTKNQVVFKVAPYSLGAVKVLLKEKEA